MTLARFHRSSEPDAKFENLRSS